jgi:hypothetical protein
MRFCSEHSRSKRTSEPILWKPCAYPNVESTWDARREPRCPTFLYCYTQIMQTNLSIWWGILFAAALICIHSWVWGQFRPDVTVASVVHMLSGLKAISSWFQGKHKAVPSLRSLTSISLMSIGICALFTLFPTFQRYMVLPSSGWKSVGRLNIHV